MKKISVFSVLSVLALPTFAEETAKTIEENVAKDVTEEVVAKNEEKSLTETVAVDENESDVVAQYEKQFEQPEYEETKKHSNPATRFPHGVQFGVGVSPTSGLNFFVGYNNKKFESFWWKRFGFRLDFANYAPIKSITDSAMNDYIGKDGLEIDKKLKLDNLELEGKHLGALIDFYPFGDTWFLGGFRVSGGYMTGNLDLKSKIHGKVDGSEIRFEIGGREYVYDGGEMHGKAKANWKYSGPYLGAGFDLGILWGFKIYADAGVVFANNHAKIDLDVPLDDLKDVVAGLPVEGNTALEEAYETAKSKAVADAQKELDKIDYYPLVKIGFMYRF